MPNIQDKTTLLFPHTCMNCKFKNLSSYVERCVNCLKEDTPENRFPKWEKY